MSLKFACTSQATTTPVLPTDIICCLLLLLLLLLLWCLLLQVDTFWCFVALMNRLQHNFDPDQRGMQQQLAALRQLVQVGCGGLWGGGQRGWVVVVAHAECEPLLG
jgi:hypothetical protein